MSTTVLTVSALQARHGLLDAVREVDLRVGHGETLALVGANGAGKTTLLRTVAGAHPAAAGSVVFDGADVTRLPAHQRVRRGIALVPEGRRLFGELTVEENLRVAARRARPGPWDLGAVLRAFPMLEPLRSRPAARLSGGQQQAASIARSVMTNPRLLLVDEVSLGLSPAAVDGVYASLTDVASHGDTTVVLVEQDLSRAMAVCDRVVCMLEGRIVLEGARGTVTREQVTAAYFGVDRNRTPTGRDHP